MKRLAKVGLLVVGLIAMSLMLGGTVARGDEIAPSNVGVPLPALTDLPWEIEHKVRPGEFLYMLAGYYYQDGRKWNWIYETNRERIAEPNHIYTGQVLIIRVPRGWEPIMPYNIWYVRMKEEFSGYKGPGGPAPAPAGSEEPGT